MNLILHGKLFKFYLFIFLVGVFLNIFAQYAHIYLGKPKDHNHWTHKAMRVGRALALGAISLFLSLGFMAILVEAMR